MSKHHIVALATSVTLLTAIAAGGGPASGQYADTLVDHSPVGGGRAENVLGPPDMQWADFDEVGPLTPGFVVVGFSGLTIRDGEGDDVVVHLRDWVGDREWFELFASLDGSNYYSLGESGRPRGEPHEPYSSAFDLAASGLSRARYLKLINGTIDPEARLEGPEVDAFGLLAYGPLADVDGDGDVDLGDLAALFAAYHECEGDPRYDRNADLDGDGCVDSSDLAILLANYRTGV